MAQTKTEAAYQLPPKKLWNSGGKVLSQNSSDTDEAGKNDDLLASEQVRHVAGAEGRGEYSDCRCGIEQLLIRSRNHPSSANLSAESVKKCINAEKMAHVADFVSKVDRQHVNQQTCVHKLD